MICAQVHTECHKSCTRYMLGARCLYFDRNAEKFGVGVIRKVRAIGRKIRQLLPLTFSARPPFQNSSTPCILNVNNTEAKQGSIMK
jgi:hypothetical protein